MYLNSELVVKFASTQFTASESSGSIEVVVGISGGNSSVPVTLTVTLSVKSPVSAMGMYCIYTYIMHNVNGKTH